MYIHPDFKNYINNLLCARCEKAKENCHSCLGKFCVFSALTELANKDLKQFVENKAAFEKYCRFRCAYCEQKTENCEKEKWADCFKSYQGELLDRFEIVNYQALCSV